MEAAPAGLGKGLKQLAYLLLKTLKKKKTYSHKEVAEEIEQKLVRKNCQRNCEYKLVQKEKNIKRRIYDALNVMISVGLLEKEQSTIRVCNSWTCSEKNYALVDRRKEYEEILKQKASWIKRKKELLGAMRSKQNAIAEWLKANEEKDQETLPKLEFPLIFVIHPANQHPLIQFSPFHTTLTGRNMKILSETDLLEEYAPRESSPAASLTDLADP